MAYTYTHVAHFDIILYLQTDGMFAVSSLGVVTLQQRLNAALMSTYTVSITISVSQQ